MTKREILKEDVLRALATWHGVEPDELGLQWHRLASSFAGVVDFTGLTDVRFAEPPFVADQVAGRAFHLLLNLAQLTQAAAELTE